MRSVRGPNIRLIGPVKREVPGLYKEMMNLSPFNLGEFSWTSCQGGWIKKGAKTASFSSVVPPLVSF